MPASRFIQQMVEEQVRRAALRTEARSGALGGRGQWPVVTFSREPGAGGTTLGRSVAERLGFACWDQELLMRIAEESGAVQSVIAAVDEHVHSGLTDFLRSLLVGVEYTQDEYRKVLTRVVGSIAVQGAAVIVGRGGHVILGPERALRVRAVCDEPERARRVALRDGIDEAAALKRVRETGHAAAAFMKHHFHSDIADPNAFDLVVNTGALRLEQATEMVVSAYSTKFGKPLTSDSVAPESRSQPPVSSIRPRISVNVL